MGDKLACCIGIFIILFIMFIAGACLNSNHGDSAPAEHIINGANDFEFPAPFSKDNWEFKESNNENETLCIDNHGNSIVVHKLNSSEFEGLNDSYMFKEDYSSSDSGVYSHEFSLVDSEIPHLYANVDVYLDGYDYIYDTLDILYIEVVEVNGNKYLVSIGNTDYTFIDGDDAKSTVKDWEEYLIKFNKENNLTTIKIK